MLTTTENETMTTQMLNKKQDNIRLIKDRAIVIDERLMMSPLTNGLTNLLLENHDLYYFKMYDESNIELSARKLVKPLFDLWQDTYEQIFYLGYKESSDMYFELYNMKKYFFDSAVLFETTPDIETTRSLQQNHLDSNYLILNRSWNNTTTNILGDSKFVVQTTRSILPPTHSVRLAKEAKGWLEYANTPPTQINSAIGQIFKLD